MLSKTSWIPAFAGMTVVHKSSAMNCGKINIGITLESPLFDQFSSGIRSEQQAQAVG
jgi:hypothetical protein